MVSSVKAVYAFDPRTREFIGMTVADESPLEPGVYLLPANTTDVPLPPVPPGWVARFATDYWALFKARESGD